MCEILTHISPTKTSQDVLQDDKNESGIGKGCKNMKNYFTSSYPHHDIYTFCYWQTFWHSIWHIFWHFIRHIFWHIFWHSTWHIFCDRFWHIFWILSGCWGRLRSSGAHWARKVPGWGPAVPSALRPLQLRSSSAHCARKLAKNLAKSWQGGSEHGSGGRGDGGEAGGGEGGGGEGGEEQLW